MTRVTLLKRGEVDAYSNDQQKNAIDSIIKTLDSILFSDDGRDSAELELDREFDEGIEQ
jgi:hypothetical protein